LVGWVGDQGVGFLIGLCFVVGSSVLALVFVECGAFVAFALGFGLVSWSCGDSAGCEVSFHMQLCLMDHLFAHVPPFLGLWCGFRCGCAVAMNKVADGGLLALAGAGVGPCLEHLEVRSESADFQFNPWFFRWLFSLPPRSSSALIVLLIFWVYVWVSNRVGCYQGAVLPERVVFVCCMCSSVLMLMLVQCNWVGCMRVTELGILCAFWMRVLGELGAPFVDGW